jgi:transcriptional regulator with XRE-family HTH domain
MISRSHLVSCLGLFVRARRKQAGYSQDRFASAVGVHRTYMGLLERGKANPTLETLDAVAQRLGLDLVELLTLAIVEYTSGTSAVDVPASGRSMRPTGQAVKRPRVPKGSGTLEPSDPKRLGRGRPK